jgi:predicted metal-binding protein
MGVLLVPSSRPIEATGGGCAVLSARIVSAPHHLFVCTSRSQSGEAGEPRELRWGAQLCRNLTERFLSWARREGFVSVPYECSSACRCPYGLATRAPGKSTCVVGDIKPGGTESAVIECAMLYRPAPTGFLRRDDHSPAVPGGILARMSLLETH